MKYIILGLVSVLLIAYAACTERTGLTNFDQSSLSADSDLIGTVWQMVSFQDANGDSTGVGAEGLRMVFDQDGKIRGGAYPLGNRFEGEYKAGTDGSLSVELIWTTEMLSIPGSRYGEFIQALRSAKRYELGGKKLQIYYNAGKVLNLEVVPPQPE